MMIITKSMEIIKQLQDEDGCTSPYLSLLYGEASKAKNILEVGVLRGRSTRAMLLGCRDGKEGHITIIDWNKNDLITNVTIPLIKELELLDYLKAWVMMDFYKLPEIWFKQNKFDLILVDIEENNNFDELLLKLNLSAESGTKIYMHNTKEFPRVKSAISKFLKTHPLTYSYNELPQKHGMGILYKLGED